MKPYVRGASRSPPPISTTPISSLESLGMTNVTPSETALTAGGTSARAYLSPPQERFPCTCLCCCCCCCCCATTATSLGHVVNLTSDSALWSPYLSLRLPPSECSDRPAMSNLQESRSKRVLLPAETNPSTPSPRSRSLLTLTPFFTPPHLSPDCIFLFSETAPTDVSYKWRASWIVWWWCRRSPSRAAIGSSTTRACSKRSSPA